MELPTIKLKSPQNKKVNIRVIPGHFATSHSHINYYVDMTIMKSRKSEAEVAAKALAQKYSTSTPIDTIVCMDGTQAVGAFLAESLTESGIMSLNAHKTMYIVSPEINSEGQLIFRDNSQMMIRDKHILLLLATCTTGRTLERALTCLNYYGGIVEGISALFSASDIVDGHEVNALFTTEDVANYESYTPNECPMCKAKRKLDAIVNSFGYSRL